MTSSRSFVALVVLALVVLRACGEEEETEVPGCKCHQPPPKQYDRNGQEIVFKPNGKRIPGGDYRHTCGGCTADWDAAILSCEECMNDEHDLVKPEPVSLNMCVRFHNENGVIVCMPGEEYKAAETVVDDEGAARRRQMRKDRKKELQKKMEEELFPQGSFKDTCEGCKITSYMGVDVILLTCERCKISPDSSETTNALLNIHNCLEVENHGGKLVCVTLLNEGEQNGEHPKEHSEL